MPERRVIARRIFFAGLAVAALAAAEPLLPTRPLQVGTETIRAEIATTTAERARGLMHRRALARDAGMLFVFGRESGEVCMWMRDTRIPLSAAFIDANGKVINIADMRPHTDDMHCAQARAEYVLEVNRGVFAAAGVKPGARIGGLPAAR